MDFFFLDPLKRDLLTAHESNLCPSFDFEALRPEYEEFSSRQPVTRKAVTLPADTDFDIGQPPPEQEDSVEVDFDLNYDYDHSNYTSSSQPDRPSSTTSLAETASHSPPPASIGFAASPQSASPMRHSASSSNSEESPSDITHDEFSRSHDLFPFKPAVSRAPVDSNRMALPSARMLRCNTCSRTFVSEQSLRYATSPQPTMTSTLTRPQRSCKSPPKRFPMRCRELCEGFQDRERPTPSP